MTGPKKPQDRRPVKPQPRKPAARVDFDLNSLEREEDEEVLPFTFHHGGKTFTLSDPNDIDLTTLADLSEDPMANLTVLIRLLGDEQMREIKEEGPIPQWKIPYLVQAWNAHYGVDLGKSAT